MSYTVNTGPQKGWYSVDITGGTATAAGGQAAIPNPEGVDLIITDAFLAVTANTDGAANLTIGTAVNATTAATNMMAATAMAAAAGSVFHLVYHGTAVGAAATPQKWESDFYVNVAASASAVGLEATLFIEYVRI